MKRVPMIHHQQDTESEHSHGPAPLASSLRAAALLADTLNIYVWSSDSGPQTLKDRDNHGGGIGRRLPLDGVT